MMSTFGCPESFVFMAVMGGLMLGDGIKRAE